jgi:glycosyltransferase involved in cell wall biosynthesis
MKEKVFVSAVIYTRNDQTLIADSLLKVDSVLRETFENYEIVLVNDSSVDETVAQARGLSGELGGPLVILNLSRTHGLEQAMMAGLFKSMGDFVFEIENAAIDFNIDYIPAMYRTALKGKDIVVLTPSTHTSLTSRMFYMVINRVTYLKLDLKTETARLVSRRALNAMLNLKEKVRYRKALYAYTGFAKESMVYKPNESLKLAQKKFNRENIGTAFDIIVSFSNIGLKSAHYLSLIFFAFCLFMGAYALYNYVFNIHVVEGWTTLMMLISFGFAGLFFIVGMIGEYISRILIEIQDRPFYTTRSIEIYKPDINKVITEPLREVAASQE